MPFKIFFFSLLIAFQITHLKGQKLGLVLSGGGAKGLAHVGVIKALEENNIPIDYIVGTSMGGIIGGMYAAGFTPEEIDSITTSKEFLQWVNGEIPDKYKVYYITETAIPKWLEINLGVDSTLEAQFQPKLANDLALNFALAEHMAAPNEVANADFDQLFVPYKAIGAEVFTQKTVLLDSGNLGASIRATMSVPFVYRPIRINGQYIFDGGIYSNFPVGVMKNEFQPDKMIGVNVASKVFKEYPQELDDKIISSSLLYMMMDKADPSSLGEGNVYIEPNLDGFSGFNFRVAGAIIDSGYVAAMRLMPEILEKIDERSNPAELAAKRKDFKQKQKPLLFSDIDFQGFNKNQKAYITKVLHEEPGKTLTIDDIRANYYKLVADPYFSDVFPEITYNSKTEKFKFTLNSNKDEKLRLQLGGNIASGSLSNIFIGAKFDQLNKWLYSHSLDGRIGEFYKSFQYKVRINTPSQFPFFIEPFFQYNNWDYLSTSSLLTDIKVNDIVQFDRKYGLNIAFPLLQKYKINLQASYLQKQNRYGNAQVFQSSDTLDTNRFSGMHNEISLQYNDLDERLFPVRGRSLYFGITHNMGIEAYNPGSTANASPLDREHSWIQLNAYYEKYWFVGFGDLGFNINAKASNMSAFANINGTLLNSPTYNPTFESASLILNNFRSPAFLAAGLKYHFTIYKNFQFRAEGHAFKPIVKWEQTPTSVSRGQLSPEYHLAAMGSLIYRTPVGPISFSAHYYDDENPFFVLLNIGFLMFNDKPLE